MQKLIFQLKYKYKMLLYDSNNPEQIGNCKKNIKYKMENWKKNLKNHTKIEF